MVNQNLVILLLFLMKMTSYKEVRVLVLYDLPMSDTENRRHYTKFRKEIMSLGCYQVQYSVYAKVLKNEIYYDSFIAKVKQFIPEKGEIRIIKVTEKQYENMIFLSGAKNNHEKKVANNNIVTF